MDLEAKFEVLWNRESNLFDLLQEPERCVFAQRLFDWSSELVASVSNNASIVFVNQAKVLLLDKYFEWRSFVPKSHRNRLGAIGHSCIFQVFCEAYESLKVVELSLTPPMLFLPQPQPAMTLPPQIAGIFIGEAEE